MEAHSMSNLIITIGRQFGSGGREIGMRLAKELGIDFYDRKLITQAAKKSGFSEELFEMMDKRATNSLLYSLSMFGGSGVNGMSLTDQLYLTQANLIREFADKGSCVIVGRCADHILREYPNRFDFFISAPVETRLARIMASPDREFEGNKNPQVALEKMDKQRATYYNYYTGKVWGKADHYDLCINAGRVGIDNSVEALLRFINYNKD
ncbi:MAG: cytidylate kinase-like family protein [Butyricicoccus sp.]|nr:cytidylate kinase-like family protein [Butyricicoccus sp.]